MKKESIYTYRDPDGLLEKIDTGTRSQFIREAVETKIRNSKTTYPMELEETCELIKFYSQKLGNYEDQINNLEQETKTIQKLKEKTTKKLQKAVQEHETKKHIIEKQQELEYNDQLQETRKQIYHKIILNMLEQKNKDTKITLNTEYLEISGKFKNTQELKTHLTSYIKNNLHEYDKIDDRIIFKDDIEYLKKSME